MVGRAFLLNFNALEDWKSRGWWRARIVRNYLPLGLFLAVTISAAWPLPGREVSKHKVGNHRISNLVLLGIIFVISGVTFQREQGWKVIRQPVGLVFGLATTLFITPMLAFVVARIPFDDPTFPTGLGIYFAAPTTLSVCTAFVISAGGNGALALMIAVISNFLGVATVPWIVRAVFDRTVLILRVPMAIFLALHVAAPLSTGAAMQLISSRVRSGASKNFTELSLVSNGCIMLMVWTTCSRSRDSMRDSTGRDIAVILAVGLCAHSLYLAFNFLCLRFVLRLPRRQLIAAVIAGSQKTLGLSAALVASLRPKVFGESDLLLVPGVLAYICQLLLDSLVTIFINKFKSDVPPQQADSSDNAAVSNAESGTVAPPMRLSGRVSSPVRVHDGIQLAAGPP